MAHNKKLTKEEIKDVESWYSHTLRKDMFDDEDEYYNLIYYIHNSFRYQHRLLIRSLDNLIHTIKNYIKGR